MLLLFIVALINFIPVVGVLSTNNLSQAYSIDRVGKDLEILLRHRALLFGVIGGFMFYSIFVPQFQGAAMVMAAITPPYIKLRLSIWSESYAWVPRCLSSFCLAVVNTSSFATRSESELLAPLHPFPG